MNEGLLDAVSLRANYRCEYCLIPDILSIPHQVDHIIAIKHRGSTTIDNLALSCALCNSYKGSDIAGIDPNTERVVQLFHPRIHSWKRHFEWQGAVISPRTAIARVTTYLLHLNDFSRVMLRQKLRTQGAFDL